MSIYTLLDRLDFLRGEPSAFLVLLAAALAIAAWDMRLVLPALALQYLASFLLFVDVLDPRLAIVYALIGMVVTLILAVTSGQVNWGRTPEGLTPAERALAGLEDPRAFGPIRLTTRQLIRLVLAVAVPIVVIALWRSGYFPESEFFPPHVQLAVIGLVMLGLTGVSTGGPLYGGVGLLILLNGFDLFNSAVEQSIALVIALAAVNLLVALAIAYLAQARYLPVDALD